jgi:hypothetical protein
MATIIFCDSVQPLPLFFVDIAEHESIAARKRMLRGRKTKKRGFFT